MSINFVKVHGGKIWGANNPNDRGAALQLVCGLLSDATSLPMPFRDSKRR
jgi:hypothetical protein